MPAQLVLDGNSVPERCRKRLRILRNRAGALIRNIKTPTTSKTRMRQVARLLLEVRYLRPGINGRRHVKLTATGGAPRNIEN